MSKAMTMDLAGAFTPEEEKQRAVKSRRMLTFLMLLAIVMFFAGLTSGYIVLMSGGYWVSFQTPSAFWWSTAFIVASSFTAQAALSMAKQGKTGSVPILLLVTLLLGIAFSVSQFKGWGELMLKGNYVSGKVLQNVGEYGTDYTFTQRGVTLIEENGEFFHPNDAVRAKPLNADLAEQRNQSSSYFYAFTWAHFAHLFFGLIAMLVMVIMAFRGLYSKEDNVGLWSGVIYWHFLGGLWIYLLLFLTFIH